MPVTRIALREGRSADWLHQLSTLFHQQLVAHFAVPPADCFQVIDCYPANQLIADRDYLGGPRSDQFILFTITAGKPRSRAQKQALYHHLAQALHQELGVPPEDVMVVITFNQAEEWSFSRGEMFNPEAV
jgi:phenylpyruvate tautomerase PptA (4-oxalocrotonate tautomerase family)